MRVLKKHNADNMRNIVRRQRKNPPRPNVLANVAANVRRLRRTKGLSQAGLARLSGLSRRMIVAIELDEANISLSNLDCLAAALGASFSEVARPPNVTDNRRIKIIAWRGSHPDSVGTLLGSAEATREAELWIWSLGEGERYPSEANSGSWHEMLLVIQGRLVVEAWDGMHEVPEGDFLVFSSDKPYVFANGGTGTVRYVRNVIL